MARQRGPLRITGTLDDITLYKTAESGYIARMKSSLDAERVKTDPAFVRSREVSEEFGRASAGGKLLRETMKTAGHHLADTRIISRLTAKFVSIIRTDPESTRGDRKLDKSDLSRLVGFEWNKYKSFGGLCRAHLQFSIDAASGLMQIDMPALAGDQDISAPEGATHFELILEGVSCSFDPKRADGVHADTGWQPLDVVMPARTLSATVPVVAGRKMMVGVGIRFGMETAGEVRMMMDRTSTAFVLGALA